MLLTLTNLFLLLSCFCSFLFSAPASGDKKLKLISESEVCASDIERLCSHVSLKDDIALLNCLQDNEGVIKSVSLKCQHFLWEYKRMLTRSDMLQIMTKDFCEADLKSLTECAQAEIGHRVPCMLDNKLQVKDPKCVSFLNEIGIAIFSDYHLIYKFVERCRADVKKFKCGRLTRPGSRNSEGTDDLTEEIDEKAPSDLSDYVTSQANTFNCLQNHTKHKDMSDDCRFELIRLAELQADDYHLNRPLYLACREDREQFCAKVQAGEGRVYDCLMKHKFHEEMSKKCRDQLVQKQEIESEDIKTDYSFFKHCENDIKKHHCIPVNSKSKNDYLKLSETIMCLESALEDDPNSLEASCKKEVNQKRVEMMEDYRITPEIIINCIDDAHKYCAKETKAEQPGAVIQCLMNYAMPSDGSSRGKIKEECKASLLHLLKLVKPSENLPKYDSALMSSCGDFASQICKHSKDDSEMFDCLITNLDHPEIPDECREKLNSLLYFISLDVTVDDKLIQKCRKSATQHCGYKKELDPVQTATLYHCMFNKFREDKMRLRLAHAKGEDISQVSTNLDKDCHIEMSVLVAAQAKKVELDPIVFESCIEDLSTYCNSGKLKHKHECLQDNLQRLKPECKKRVIEFSQMEDTEMKFNSLLERVCRPMVNKLCDGVPEDDVVECLIKKKEHPKMSNACRIGLEHWQIISLQEYEISQNFAEFCKKDIQKYCRHEIEKNNGHPTKSDIISCLSKSILNGYLKDGANPLSKQCANNFNFELLQQSQTIKLDPELEKQCNIDIKQYCSEIPNEEKQTCLRKHQDELSNECHRFLFQRERFEAQDTNLDGQLIRKCSDMIQQYCSKSKSANIFQCLHKYIDETDFDAECRTTVLIRLQRRMNDVRLNPGLLKDCKTEIEKYCKPKDLINPDIIDQDGNIELEGKIITCLRNEFTKQKELGLMCKKRISAIISESNVYLILDPVLRKNCKQDIEKLCKKELTKPYEADYGSVQTCLKHNFMNKMIESDKCQKEIVRLLRETRADIHMDYRLFQACESSVMKLCGKVEFGNGQKISCLLNYVNSNSDSESTSKDLDKECLSILLDRKKMWEQANSQYPESLAQVVESVRNSKSRNYLIFLFAGFVGFMLIIGILCGRVTKRVPVDLKNK